MQHIQNYSKDYLVIENCFERILSNLANYHKSSNKSADRLKEIDERLDVLLNKLFKRNVILLRVKAKKRLLGDTPLSNTVFLNETTKEYETLLERKKSMEEVSPYLLHFHNDIDTLHEILYTLQLKCKEDDLLKGIKNKLLKLANSEESKSYRTKFIKLKSQYIHLFYNYIKRNTYVRYDCEEIIVIGSYRRVLCQVYTYCNPNNVVYQDTDFIKGVKVNVKAIYDREYVALLDENKVIERLYLLKSNGSYKEVIDKDKVVLIQSFI